MNLEPEKWTALLNAMEAEKAAVAGEIEVTGLTLADGSVAFDTKHGEHESRIVSTMGGCSLGLLRLFIDQAVGVHARRMPRHMEFQALGKGLAA